MTATTAEFKSPWLGTVMAGKVRKGCYLDRPHGNHPDMYDDQLVSMDGLVKFLKDVDEERF